MRIIKSTSILVLLLLSAACQSDPGKTGRLSGAPHVAVKAKSNAVPAVVSAITPVVSGIEGIYKAQPIDGDIGICDMSVEIKKHASGYSYVFDIQGEIIKGKATLTKGDRAGENYITFEGIKWAEYEGDVSNKTDDDSVTTSLPLPVGIDGLLTQKEITIQNTGNAMNYYVKIAACDRKYIRLVKK